MQKILPNIFEYIDFKKYLKDYRDKRKEWDSGFTNQYICHRLGQKNSKSYFNNIISGRKPLTSDFIDRLIELLQLREEESKYFRALVNYNQSFSPKEKEYHFERVVGLNNTPAKFIDQSTFAYFNEWYHVSVRECIDILGFDGDYKKLATMLEPNITVLQAKKSVSLLKKLGLVTENNQGVVSSTTKVLTTGENVKSAILEQYQVKALQRAQEKILNPNTSHQSVVTTLSLSPQGLNRVVKLIKKFKAELRSLAHKDNEQGKKVYEFIIHAHSQSK